MLGLLTAMAMVASAVPARPGCAMDRLAACRDTNQLVWTPGFTAALKAFLGSARGSYLYDDRPVFDQVDDALGGPPDDPRRLADGAWLFTACRVHSCTEKAGVVIASDGTIRAAGLLSFDCHRTPRGQPGCEKGPTLTVFVPRIAGAARQPFVAALTDWATTAAAADRKGAEAFIGPFQGVVIRGILDEREAVSRHPPRRAGGHG